MAKITEITIPTFRIQEEYDDWNGRQYYVQQRQGNGRWKTVSNKYCGLHSAKAKLGSIVLELIAEAEEA